MFKTIAASEIKSDTFCTEDIKSWDSVQIHGTQRWYHVFYVTKELTSEIDNDYLNNHGILLTASLDEVFELVEKHKIVIEEIQIMLPPTSNLSERWNMLFVKQIFRGFIPNGGLAPIYRICTDFSHSFHDSSAAWDRDQELQDQQLMFEHYTY